MQAADATRIEVYDRDDLRISQRVGFQCGHGVAFNDVDCGFFYFFLYRRSAVELTVVFSQIVSSGHFHSFEACFDRFEAALSFSSPSLIFERVPIRAISIIRDRRVGGALC